MENLGFSEAYSLYPETAASCWYYKDVMAGGFIYHQDKVS